MKEVAVQEAETRPSQLLAEVEKGGQFIITRRGEAVASLAAATPAATKRSQAQAQRQRVSETLYRLKRLRASTTLDLPPRQGVDCVEVSGQVVRA